ncbi:MAG TPA: cupredoxin domain-containing protein [Acetobacteraceae bacterium]|jgi:plastocyanin|nr:cupredoxin domain-containing protein [Acetobacteraceae bacterium]
MTVYPARRSNPGLLVLLMIGACLAGASAAAEEPNKINIELKDHRFDPAEIHVQAGKPTILVVTNHDSTAEEFESSALKVEKIIAAGHYATIKLRPLSPGRYPFVGEFNPGTAKGTVVAE